MKPGTDADDDALLVALQGNTAERRRAIDLLYTRYADAMRRYFRLRGIDASQAEDLCQDTFVKLVRSSGSFQARGQGRAWIWQVARSIWLDHQRVKSRDRAVPEDQVPEPADGSSTDGADRDDCVQRQFTAFSARHPEAAQAVFWAAVEQMTSAEIGALLDRTPGATREFLVQSRRRLETFLAICREYWAA